MPSRLVFFVLLLFALALSACGASGTVDTPLPPPATDFPASEPTASAADTLLPTNTPLPPLTAPTGTPSALATGTPLPATSPTPVNWQDYESQNAEGFYERGNPDAPVTILDYSDFL